MISELKPYLEYKDSGLQWLEKIPSHWEEQRAKYLFREVDERSIDGQEELLSVSHITGVTPRSQKNVTMFMAESYIGHKLCQPHDLIINTMWAWMAALGIAKQKGIVSPSYAVYRPANSNEFNPEFMDHLLRTDPYKTEYICRSIGIRASRLRLYPEEFLEIPIACPPLEDQIQMVAFLNSKDLFIRRFIRAKRRLIELLGEQKQAIIHRAITRGFDPNVCLKPSGIEWLGEVPDHWRIEPAFVYFKEQFTPNTDNFVTNVLSLSYGKIIPRNVETNFGLLPASFETYQIVEPGNIIMRLTDLQNDQKSLRVGLSSHRGIITSAYLCLKVNEGIMPEYAYNLLHSYDLTKVFYGMGGGCRQSIGYDDIKRLPILIPSLSEQAEICKHIDSNIQLIDILTESTRKKIDSIREYRTRLISDVVTGKLDVRSVTLPAAEAAEVPDKWDGTLEPEADVSEGVDLFEVAQEEAD